MSVGRHNTLSRSAAAGRRRRRRRKVHSKLTLQPGGRAGVPEHSLRARARALGPAIRFAGPRERASERARAHAELIRMGKVSFICMLRPGEG